MDLDQRNKKAADSLGPAEEGLYLAIRTHMGVFPSRTNENCCDTFRASAPLFIRRARQLKTTPGIVKVAHQLGQVRATLMKVVEDSRSDN